MDPLFIVGVPRSGTTLLRELLASSDQISLPENEFQIIPWMIAVVKDPNKLTDGEKVKIKKAIANSAYTMHANDSLRGKIIGLDLCECESLDHVIRKVLTFGLDPEGAIYFGDKTPRNLFYLDVIRQIFPSMKVINIVRDARDVVASMKSAWGTSYVRGACTWVDGMKCAKNYADKYPSEILSIKYEDLCHHTEKVLREISHFLDVEFQDKMLIPRNAAEKMGAAAGRTDVVRRKISKFSNLTASSLYRIESIVGEELLRLGYPLVNLDCKANYPNTGLLKILRVRDFLWGFGRQIREKGLVSGVAYRIKQNIYR
jgi:hypothetical protein